MVSQVVEISSQLGLKLTILPPHRLVELQFANAHHEVRVALSPVTVRPHAVLAAHRAEQIVAQQIWQRILDFDLGLLLLARTCRTPPQTFDCGPAARTARSPEQRLQLCELSP